MKTKYYNFLKNISEISCKNIDDVNLLSDKFDDFADFLEEDYDIDNSTNEKDNVIEHFRKFDNSIGQMIACINTNELSIKEFNTFLNNIISSELKYFS